MVNPIELSASRFHYLFVHMSQRCTWPLVTPLWSLLPSFLFDFHHNFNFFHNFTKKKNKIKRITLIWKGFLLKISFLKYFRFYSIVTYCLNDFWKNECSWVMVEMLWVNTLTHCSYLGDVVMVLTILNVKNIFY